MATQSWSTVVEHSSDATFRAWGSELAAKFAAVGMVQTADTGQINWVTVTRPAINTVGGYEIWRLSGSALYFKIEYGTAGFATVPGLWFTCGTGSNGTGTLTGQLSTRVVVNAGPSALTSVGTARQSYLCATADFFGLAYKLSSTGVVNDPLFLFGAGRTSDATGAPTAVGNYVFYRTASTALTLQTIRQAATAATRVAGSSFCVFVGRPATSSDGTNNQAYLHWLDTPAVLPALYTASIIAAELAIGNTATITLFGSTPHTYISAAAGGSMTFDAFGTTAIPMGLIMLWE